MRLTTNILALLFGPFYFFAKGMWRKGLTLLVAGFIVLAVLAALGVPSSLRQAVGYGFSVLAMMTANFAYFLHVTRASTSWNPFEGLSRRRGN